jgi:tetratricopeptide (TPR) repeat protein
MFIVTCAKSIVAGLLLAALVKLPGAAVWGVDPYGLAAAGLVARDMLPVQPDPGGNFTMEILGALQAHDKRDGDGVIARLSRAVLLSPEDWSLRRALGAQLAELGRGPEAVEQLEMARDANPEDPVAWYELARAYNLARQPEAAMEAGREALRLRPLWAAAHLRLGLIQLDGGLHDAGFDQLQAAINCPTVPAQVYFELGNYYLQHGSPSQAVVYLKQALELQPRYSFAANNLGNAYKALKLPKEAREWYLKAIAMDPANPNPRNALGVIYKEEHMPKAALDAFLEAVAKEPSYFDAHYNAGVLLLELHRDQEALAQLRLAIAIRPRSAIAHYQLAVAEERMGLLQEAAASFKLAELLDPNLRAPADQAEGR